MKLKTARILSIITAVIQLVALLISVVIILCQTTVKQVFGVGEEILGVNTIPVAALCAGIFPLLLYGIVSWILFASSNENRKLTAGVFLILNCVLYVALSGLPAIEVRTVSTMMGINEMVSLNTLNQAISMVCMPFRISAFALSCFILGGYCGLNKEE